MNYEANEITTFSDLKKVPSVNLDRFKRVDIYTSSELNFLCSFSPKEYELKFLPRKNDKREYDECLFVISKNNNTFFRIEFKWLESLGEKEGEKGWDEGILSLYLDNIHTILDKC